MFVPKSLICLKNYSWKQFSKDLVAGVVVGFVALPLAMAFAIGSHVPPAAGLFTAIVAGFLISALGGSRVQIGGPTGAFVVIVAGIVDQFGYQGLVVATVLAGFMLILMGLCRLGAAVKFIPYPVTTGFTSGIALIIFSGQMNDLFGLGIPRNEVPSRFFAQWDKYLHAFGRVDWGHAGWVVGLSAFCLAVLVLWPKVMRRVPSPIVAMVLGTLAAYVLGLFGVAVDTIQGIPRQAVNPQWPSVTLDDVEKLVGPAATIAFLAAVESLLSAVVADGMIGGRHKPNMELVAQGVANIASPLLGGIPATGAIARTATNVKTGGRTPVAGMVHSVVVLVVMLAFAPLASYVPLCALAAVLVVVAYNMAEVHKFGALLGPPVKYLARRAWAFGTGKGADGLKPPPMSDALVLLVTFLLTVSLDLTLAVGIGLVLAFFLFVKRMADVTNVQVLTRELKDNGETADPNAIATRTVPHGVEVYEVNGPFFFGVVDKVKDLLGTVTGKPKVFILRMRHVPMMDATGLNALLELRRSCARQGITLVLAEIHTLPFVTLDHSGHREEFGADNVTAHIDDALNRARKLLGLPEVEGQTPRVPEVARDRTPPPSTVFLREPPAARP
jgi:SulP family sulfate permease